MERRDFLRVAAFAVAGQAVAWGAGEKRPNVLFITVDDMNCDSVGVFGCEVKDTTPELDKLAGEGIWFEYAHVQVANCVPSRNVMQTGRYPHTSGVEGFYKLKPDFPILPDLLKQSGYFTGIKGKVSHSTPYQPYPWDTVMDVARERADGKGNPRTFHRFTSEAIAASKQAGKPFYLVVNIIDPHKPFYAMGKQSEIVPDKNKPTRVFTPEEIVVPGFLPDLPIARMELAHYYSSVRRSDDCVAATLEALRESGAAENTVVMFLSDHGMPFPFAKTNVYHHSTRTPWIVRWPGRIKPGAVERTQMISAIDFMPTVLEIAGIPRPKELQGRSFLPLLLGEKQTGRDHVIKEYNENSGGARHPMRCVETKKYCYIFNPWANGTRQFRTATQGMQTYKKMVELAETDNAIAARVKLFDYRAVEEFYDVEKDRDALHNLIGERRYEKEIDRLRKLLEGWMVETGDHCLEAFRNRDQPEALERYVVKLEEESRVRQAKNRQNKKPPGSNKRKDQANILTLAPPSSARRGQSITLAINYEIAADLGEQLIHVTLKGQDGKRVGRKVEKCRGTGTLKVSFAVPDEAGLETVTFAAFVGKDYPSCLQHVVSKPIPVR